MALNGCHLESTILNFLIFLQRQKTKKNDSTLIKINKRMLKWSKCGKIGTIKKANLFGLKNKN